jgi:glutathione S-transferase
MAGRQDRAGGATRGGYKALDAMEAHPKDRAYLVGGPTRWPTSRYAYARRGRGIDLDRYPAIRAWLGRVASSRAT